VESTIRILIADPGRGGKGDDATRSPLLVVAPDKTSKGRHADQQPAHMVRSDNLSSEMLLNPS
jgi:hypothetical protein